MVISYSAVRTDSGRRVDHVDDVLGAIENSAPRTPGFLINYGLPVHTAQALIRGGWSTVTDLDRTERAWSTAVRHGTDCSFAEWLRVNDFGVVNAAHLRHALTRWRARDPAPPRETPKAVRVATSVRARIAAGEFDHGAALPTMAATARAHGMVPTKAANAYDMLVLAGWCAWRVAPGPTDWRERWCAVALLPDTPYDVTWAPDTTAGSRRRATDAVELLRHNPGAWQDNDTLRTLRALAPIADAVFADRERALTITGLT
jgi:hypothetical protein